MILYARAWDSEYDEPIFDSDYNIPVKPNSPEITVRSDEAANKMRGTPGTIREKSPEIISQTETQITTCNLMRILVQSNLTLRQPTPAAQNSVYVLTPSQILMTITDTDSVPQPFTERIRTLSGNPRNVLWN